MKQGVDLLLPVTSLFFQVLSCLHSRLEGGLSQYIPNSIEGDIQVQKPLELGGNIGHYRGHFLSKASWIPGYKGIWAPTKVPGQAETNRVASI